MDVGVSVGVGVSAGLGVIIIATGDVAVGVGITAEVIGTTTAGDVAIGIGSGVGRNNLRTASAAPIHKVRTTSPNTIVQTAFVRCLAIKSGYSCMTTPLHSGPCQFFLHSPSLPLLAPKPAHLRIHAGLVHRVETAMDILVLPLASWCYCSTEVDWRVVQRESSLKKQNVQLAKELAQARRKLEQERTRSATLEQAMENIQSQVKSAIEFSDEGDPAEKPEKPVAQNAPPYSQDSEKRASRQSESLSRQVEKWPPRTLSSGDASGRAITMPPAAVGSGSFPSKG